MKTTIICLCFLFIIIIGISIHINKSNKCTQEHFSSVHKNNLYDLLIPVSPFDSVKISDTILEKEIPTTEIIKRLKKKPDIDVDTLTSFEIVDLLSKQLGAEYEVKYFESHNDYYEILLQSSRKMYGFLIVLAKRTTWEPIFKGIIFDDKINLLPGATEKEYSEPSDYPIYDAEIIVIDENEKQ